MRHLRLTIQHQLGVETGKTVVLRREGHVVIGGEILEVNPALPRCHQRAILATGLQLCKNIIHLLPGRHIRVRINTGRAHRITVHPQNRRRRVERQRQHLAFGRCVIAFDRADIGIRVERRTAFGHHLIYGLDGAAGGHHGRCADFKHHENMGLLFRAECGDARVQRFGIVTLVALNYDIVVLAGIEIRNLPLHQLAKTTGESVPELNFRLRHCSHRGQQGAGDRKGTNKALLHVSSKAPLVVLHSIC